MPRYCVSGDIICGAFVHYVDAESAEAAIGIVEQLTESALDSVSQERPFARVDSAIEEESATA